MLDLSTYLWQHSVNEWKFSSFPSDKQLLYSFALCEDSTFFFVVVVYLSTKCVSHILGGQEVMFCVLDFSQVQNSS